MISIKPLTIIVVGASLIGLYLFGEQAGNPEYVFESISSTGSYSPGVTPSTQAPSDKRVTFARKDGASGKIIYDTNSGKTVRVTSYESLVEGATVIVSEIGNETYRTTYPAPPEKVAFWTSRPYMSDCTVQFQGVSRVLPPETVFGIQVQHFMVEDSAGRIEYFMAPSLGCLEMKMVAEWKDTAGKFVSYHKVEPISLNLEAPPTKWFNIGNDAPETTPSQVRDRRHEFFWPGRAIPQCWKRRNAVMDKSYATLHELQAKGWPSGRILHGSTRE